MLLPRNFRGTRASVAIHCVLALGAGAIFWMILPHGGWGHWDLFLVLLALAGLSVGAGELLGSPAQFDATFAVTLVAIVLCGPLPALAIQLTTEVAAAVLISTYTPRKHQMLANGTSFAWAIIAAWAVLTALGTTAAVALGVFLLTGAVKTLVNFFVARGVVGTVVEGFSLETLVRHELIPMVPAILVMLLLAAGAVALIPALGILALAVFAVIVGVPQAAATTLVRSRSVADIKPLDATRLYARALADHLQLSTRDRNAVSAAAALLEADSAGSHDGKARAFEDAIGGEHSVIVAALYVDECWDGTGRPGQLRGNAIPQISRVLSVARAWSDMTAQGTAALSHSDALARLSQRAGFAFDPEVVTAATEIVNVERALDPAPAFAPRLHRIPAPRALRGALPRLVGNPAAAAA